MRPGLTRVCARCGMHMRAVLFATLQQNVESNEHEYLLLINN